MLKLGQEDLMYLAVSGENLSDKRDNKRGAHNAPDKMGCPHNILLFFSP